MIQFLKYQVRLFNQLSFGFIMSVIYDIMLSYRFVVFPCGFLLIFVNSTRVELERNLLKCARTKFDTINLTNCDIQNSDMLADFELIFPNTKTFIMSHNRHYSFPSHGEPFVNHTGVLDYQCDWCNISAVYNRTFANVRLRYLSLRHNSISAIHADAFNYNSLRSITLIGNQISNYNDRNELRTMQHLNDLDMSHNKGFELDTMQMAFGFLRDLFCRHCAIRRLQEDFFKKLVYLTELYIDHNHLTRIHPQSFANNRYISVLSLNGNPLEKLELHSRSLQTLFCNGCRLQSLDNASVSHLPALETLELRQNLIHRISADALQQNVHLSRFLIDNNQLSSVPIALLKSLTKLQVLCVDFNPWEVSHHFVRFQLLYRAYQLRQKCSAGNDTILQFEHVDITDKLLHPKAMMIHPLFNNTLCNDRVDLWKRDIVSMDPRSYKNCNSFSQLLMNHNRRYRFPSSTPFLISDSLRLYSCVNCGIDTIYSETFEQVPKLSHLDISHNYIVHLHDEIFRNNHELASVTISFSHLREFPLYLLAHHKQLQSIDLSGNRAIQFQREQPLLIHPKVVSYRCLDCGIRKIFSCSFSSMPMLQMIDLSDNHIQFIADDVFANNTALGRLNLYNTDLLTFPAIAIEKLPNLCLGLNLPTHFDPGSTRDKKRNALILREHYAGTHVSCNLNDDPFMKLIMTLDSSSGASIPYGRSNVFIQITISLAALVFMWLACTL